MGHLMQQLIQEIHSQQAMSAQPINPASDPSMISNNTTAAIGPNPGANYAAYGMYQSGLNPGYSLGAQMAAATSPPPATK